MHSLIDSGISNIQFAGENLQCIMQYKTDLEQLVSYMQLITREWQNNVDTFYSGQRNSGAYKVSELSSSSHGTLQYK